MVYVEIVEGTDLNRAEFEFLLHADAINGVKGDAWNFMVVKGRGQGRLFSAANEADFTQHILELAEKTNIQLVVMGILDEKEFDYVTEENVILEPAPNDREATDGPR